MKKEKAKLELEKLLNCEISRPDVDAIEDWFNSYEELVGWCEPHDESYILIDEEVDITGFKMINYVADREDRDITAFIVVMDNDDVFSYGYSGD
jgi:hypothetical protein